MCGSLYARVSNLREEKSIAGGGEFQKRSNMCGTREGDQWKPIAFGEGLVP